MLNLKRQNYVDWDVKSVFKLLDRDNYAYRVVLKFQDGTQQTQQKSGFQTKREAEDARKHTIGELSNGTYVVNSNVKLKEFLEYWLEYDIRQRVGSANTYSSYSQTVKLHITPYLGSVLSETRIPCFIRLQKFPKSHFHLYFLPSFCNISAFI